jgi:tetratricopeptide (TPR) repeat protein
MDCKRIAQQASKLATLISVFVFSVIALVHSMAAVAQVPSQAREVLEQSRKYQFQFRTGDMTVIQPWVVMLEQATKAEPENADLWYWMGYVYLAQGAQALLAGKPAEAMPAMQKGPAALRQALKINPNHAEALSQLGGIQTMLGPVLQLPAMAPRGVAQMNRAVELAPQSIRVRLMRAFAGPNLPAELRNQAVEAEDLDYLISVSEWGTAGDYMRIMRGDLNFEYGKPEQARVMYRSVENTGSGASMDAKARLAALDAGSISMADIKALRAAVGAQCAMCHDR